eukprot:11521476-Alexandrium_andersonii.AAC.1
MDAVGYIARRRHARPIQVTATTIDAIVFRTAPIRKDIAVVNVMGQRATGHPFWQQSIDIVCMKVRERQLNSHIGCVTAEALPHRPKRDRFICLQRPCENQVACFVRQPSVTTPQC